MLRYLLMLLCLPALAHAQQSAKPVQVGASLHRGFIIHHSRELIDVSSSLPTGLECQINWLLADEKHVRQAGLIARRGISLYYMNFNNPEILGHSLAVVPYVEPLIRPGKRLHGSFQLGLGVAYLSKVYDAESNPDNLFFSSPLSFWAMVNARAHYRINPQWQASLGLNYNHISNGGMKEPNKGMNFPTFNAGVQYQLQPVHLQKPLKNQDWKQEPRTFQYLLAVGSVKNIPSSQDYPEVEATLLLGGQWMIGRRVGRMSGLSVGTEWLYDGYAAVQNERNGRDQRAIKGALLLGHELLVGRVRFTIHLAPYVYNPSRGQDDPLYQRYGLYYRFGKHLLLGSTLKAHRHVADVADVRVGWLF